MTKTITEPEVNFELAKKHGLTEEEYQKIQNVLGRIPTFTELGIYSVMWSEHCSYKNSILEIKKLPRSGGKLLVGAGEENAGLVDIGDGYAAAFKIESHNHPSAVEPYQGAATGVGGIHRDIFTMGARPIATLDSLRFGDLDNPRVQFLLNGVVKGISGYGNSFGVPTVAGEVYFDKSYQGNPLVNAMSVGIVEVGKTASATAKGKGNPVLIVGSATGRDGIHGATFASEEISEKSEAKRPSVQVGDPFTEKLLLEATLEAIASGFVVGIQDMGAAGISCSTSEMSAKGEVGMIIDLDKVPARETGMTAYELMLSESQERMLIVVTKGKEQEIIKIFEKWDLPAAIIGEVTDEERVKIYKDGELKADIPPHSLVLGGGAPVYVRERKRPDYLDKVQNADLSQFKTTNPKADILKLLGSPNIASKRWVYEQYDTMVRTNSMTLPGQSDAAVIRVKGTKKALAVKTDCNGRYVYLNPRLGGQIAVAEAARNVACTGAIPLAITNCLNFGNPYKPEIYWQFSEALGGMADACKVFETPVTGGNVSFYNENPDGAVFPTPTIGMLGLLEDIETNGYLTYQLETEGETLFLIGETKDELGGTEFLSWIHKSTLGNAPSLDLQVEKRLHQFLHKAYTNKYLTTAHDLSDGGFIISVSELLLARLNPKLGIEISDLPTTAKTIEGKLFSETQSRVIVSAKKGSEKLVLDLAKSFNLTIQEIGKTNLTGNLKISEVGEFTFDELADPYYNAILNKLKK